nr:zinc finger protein BRUTUS-like At1g74770 [Tanacetum cinerariifolium]
MQWWLLYASLEMMSFGLLKCTVTWFLSHISDDESKSILHSIKQRGLVVNKSLSSLLCEWIRIGYSGKTSVEKFRLELHATFGNRCSFLSEQIKKGVSTTSSVFNSSSMYDTSYSSGSTFMCFFLKDWTCRLNFQHIQPRIILNQDQWIT